jgi:hypothetical protein
VELARTVRLAGGSRSVPAGPDYDNKPVSRSVGPRSSSHEITWSDSTAGSATFNSEAAAEGIRGTAGVVGIPGAEGIVEGVRRIRISISAVGITGRVRIIRIRAELAVIVPLLVVEPRRIGGERIRRRVIAEGTVV